MAEVMIRGRKRTSPLRVRRKRTCFHKLWGINPDNPASAPYNRRIARAGEQLRKLDRKLAALRAKGLASPRRFA